ncbi:hypothetical protein H6P81_009606 [Aristolochia fimbriata]|uniref:CREG-like beta-barrel domain-containing protein n=1 Tax=Aristolochia fimbriata TaxID=158543 RepID=A0AAV7EPL0_ARIFI|nr:hypothetical protein H6P81_009606 [Aristolochia fimbriata]
MAFKQVSYLLLVVLFLPLLFESSVVVNGRLLLPNQAKPDRKDYVAYARWLASQNSWGVLSTISTSMEGSPFANVVSYSDGVPGHGQGIPYFYLSTLDPTARDIEKDHRASFAVSEVPVGTCGSLDPEEPPCAKLTLTGKLYVVPNNTHEADIAKDALFSKHPIMKWWPKNHNFQIYKLDIENIFMINWYGGGKPITVEQYLQYAKMEKLAMTSFM